MPPAARQAVMNAADMLAPAMTVGEVRESLDTTQKGQTANTIANCRTVFQCDPLLKGAVRFNLVAALWSTPWCTAGRTSVSLSRTGWR